MQGEPIATCSSWISASQIVLSMGMNPLLGCRDVKAASHHTTESTVSVRELGEHGAKATVYIRHSLDQVT